MALFVPKQRFVPGLNSFGKAKTPPGQIATEKFPVLTYGETPSVSTTEWRLRVWGEVEEELVWTWNDFMKLPQTTIRADFHCVTTWSRFGDDWSGVLVRDLIPVIRPKRTAAFVMQHAYGGYTTNNALQILIEEDAILAHTLNGKPLPVKHGGPMRVFTPRRYAWKGAKWVNGLEFMSKDRPGFWEQNGYNTPADPWKEERFG
jgi:DMSO/TMAO reductase YedYZ molybdopterin-dependent catalytic subunit